MKTIAWALSAAMGMAAPTTVHAQTDPPVAGDESEPDDLGEIVVTAQKRSERLQDVPVAVSAFGSESLQSRAVISLEQIAPKVPSFYFGSFGASRPQLYIRGIGTRQFDAGSESSVGVFSDDVYVGRSGSVFGALKDIERIEVLRGPQGTLYGRNTIAGALNIISKAPSTTLDATVEAGIGNFGSYEGLIAAGGPVAGDGAVKARLALWRTFRDGYVTNLNTGYDFQGIDNYGGRARLTIEPVAPLTINLTAELSRDRGDGFGGINQGALGNPDATFLGSPGRRPRRNPSMYEGYLTIDPTLRRNVGAYIGRAELDLDTVSLTSITAYRTQDVRDTRDLEGSSLSVVDLVQQETSKQFTQELRLASTPGGLLTFGGAVEWIVGAFYYEDSSSREDTLLLGPDSQVGSLTGMTRVDSTFSDFETQSYALFGQATITVLDDLELTLGGRYTRDEKAANFVGVTDDARPVIPAPFTHEARGKWSSVDPRAVLTYKPSSDITAYVSFTTGFKSGGFQLGPFTPAQAAIIFDPEEITAYEVGVKSQWLDRTIQVNAAAFYYDYKNLQVSRTLDLGGGAAAVLITNAAESTVKGFDLEVSLRPSNMLSVNVAYGFLDARYDRYVFNATTDFSGTPLVRAPDHSINVGAEWRIPLNANDVLTFGADYSLLDDFIHEPGGAPLVREDGYGLLDLRVGLVLGNVRLLGYVNNATNKIYRRSVNALGPTAVDYAGQPRTFGLRLSWHN